MSSEITLPGVGSSPAFSPRLPIHKRIEIATSSWFTKLPPGHIRIGISRSVPRGFTGIYKRYEQLNPGPWFKSLSPQQYIDRYFADILGSLDPASVVDDLAAITQGDVAVLVCWEPPPPSPAWCHRGLISAWLHDALGLAVPELNHEGLGHGWRHPKLPLPKLLS